MNSTFSINHIKLLLCILIYTLASVVIGAPNADVILHFAKTNPTSADIVPLIEQLAAENNASSRMELHKVTNLFFSSTDIQLQTIGVESLAIESQKCESSDVLFRADVRQMLDFIRKCNDTSINMPILLNVPRIKGLQDSDFLELVNISIDKMSTLAAGDLQLGPEAIFQAACWAIGPRSYDLLKKEASTNKKINEYIGLNPAIVLQYTNHPDVLWDAVKQVQGKSLKDIKDPRLYADIIARFTLLRHEQKDESQQFKDSLPGIYRFLGEVLDMPTLPPAQRANLLKLCLAISTKDTSFADTTVALAAKYVDATDTREAEKITHLLAEVRSAIQNKSTK